MATPHTSTPRKDTPVPPASGDVVVPLRPKPPALPAISPVSRPVIIEQDVIDYLVKVPLEQRWRILSRVAMATYDEPAPASVTPPPASAPPPPSQRPQLELVDQTRESTREARAAASTAPPPPPSVPRVGSAAPARASAPPRASVPAPAPRSSVAAPPPSSPRPVSSAPHPSVPRPASSAPPRLAYSAPPPPPPTEKQAGDHTEELFEVMHDLTLCGDAPSGARFCLDVALAAVPSLAGLVHLRDPRTLELVVVHAQGPRADGLLRTRTPQNDALVARAARAGKPTVATYGAEPDAEKTVCPRHAFFDPWSVMVAPVIHGGQLLGLLEIVDPIDGSPFDPVAQSSLAYVADRLAKFLVEHPAG